MACGESNRLGLCSGVDRLSPNRVHRSPEVIQRVETNQMTELKYWLSTVIDHQQAGMQKLLEDQHLLFLESVGKRIDTLGAELGRSLFNDGARWCANAAQRPEASTIAFTMPEDASAVNGSGASGSPDDKTADEHQVEMQTQPAGVSETNAQVGPTVNTHRLTNDGATPLMKALDVGIAVVILSNTVVMFAEAEWRGMLAGQELEDVPDDSRSTWPPGAEEGFAFMDHVFNVIFMIELIARVCSLRCKYFRETQNCFDAAIVSATSVDAYIVRPLGLGEGHNLGIARLIRIFRVVRVLRVFRFAKHFSELRVLARTLGSSAWALLWSMFLLSIILFGAGIFMTQFLAGFVSDSSRDLDTRRVVFRYYGSAAKASYTMFEATFSGSWPNYARFLVEDVNAFFAVFFVLYNVIITFALLRVIGSLFLQETLKASGNDAEMMLMEKLKEKEAFAAKLHRFFSEADTSGDGLISVAEFEAILADPTVRTWLQVLELEIYEVTALFNILDDNSDGTVSYDEFLGGAMRLKGSARAIDSISMMHEQHKIRANILHLGDGLDQVMKVLCPGQPGASSKMVGRAPGISLSIPNAVSPSAPTAPLGALEF